LKGGSKKEGRVNVTRINKKGSRSNSRTAAGGMEEWRGSGKKAIRPISIHTYSNPTIVSKCFVQATPTTNFNNKRKVKDDDDDDDDERRRRRSRRRRRRRRSEKEEFGKKDNNTQNKGS
jgi:hypothetical protein